MIYYVDEDSSLYEGWLSELTLAGHEVKTHWNATEAYAELMSVPLESTDLVIIDVMLAVKDIRDEQFSSNRTGEYTRTGLVLLEDLATANPAVFPRRAVLLTNATEGPLQEAQHASTVYDVELWLKSTFLNSRYFVEKVSAWLRGHKDEL